MRCVCVLCVAQVLAFLQEHLGDAVVATCPEASYLIWVDVAGVLPHGLPLRGHATAASYFEEHGVGFSDGAEVSAAHTGPTTVEPQSSHSRTP